MWWTWIFYSRGSARRSCQCVIRSKLPLTAVDCLGRVGPALPAWAASWLTVTVEVGRDMRVGPTYLIQKISWNRTFSVWWKYYGSVISDRLCFICLIWHTRGDKPVLPWLSRKNSDLLVRKNTLDTVERWLRMLGPGRHVTVRLHTTDPAVYLQLRS